MCTKYLIWYSSASAVGDLGQTLRTTTVTPQNQEERWLRWTVGAI